MSQTCHSGAIGWETGTREQAKELLTVPDRSTLKGKRDYAILAVLVGCALRRDELATLEVDTLQMREGRWVLADLVGKGGRGPHHRGAGLGQADDQCLDDRGRHRRGQAASPRARDSKVVGDGLSAWAVWSVVEQSAKQIGIERFGAHDLRRTCANVWSAALSQAKSDLTGWSAQMYSTFGGVYDSWPGWNALRPLPI